MPEKNSTASQITNEVRFYLTAIKDVIEEGAFVPQYIVTAVKLPTGAIELAVNHTEIFSKINYILSAYDDDMCLIANPQIKMENILIV